MKTAPRTSFTTGIAGVRNTWLKLTTRWLETMQARSQAQAGIGIRLCSATPTWGSARLQARLVGASTPSDGADGTPASTAEGTTAAATGTLADIVASAMEVTLAASATGAALADSMAEAATGNQFC